MFLIVLVSAMSYQQISLFHSSSFCQYVSDFAHFLSIILLTFYTLCYPLFEICVLFDAIFLA